ncbi:hypothetical protein FB451DRAFT_1566517 [Mycena latifolia]|nr:hypothetical protein FB451DRAFT_1566517 [Mycena latifolia]
MSVILQTLLMISSALVALSAVILSVTAAEIQSMNPSFFNAGIQGCISAADNEDGSPLFIHDCNTHCVPWARRQTLSTCAELGRALPTRRSTELNTGRQGLPSWADNGAERSDLEHREPRLATSILHETKCGTSNDHDLRGQVHRRHRRGKCRRHEAANLDVLGGKHQPTMGLRDRLDAAMGGDKCIDLTDGKITDGNALQIWTCDSMNFNQRWVGMPDPDVAKWCGDYIRRGR